MDAQTPASISIEQKNEIADLYEKCIEIKSST